MPLRVVYDTRPGGYCLRNQGVIMTSGDTPERSSNDLLIVQYLNQRLTFDLLATIEDGFAHLTTVESLSQRFNSDTTSGQAGFTVGNVFAFLGISLDAKISGDSTDAESDDARTTEQLIHTPASLFARLRSILVAEGLVAEIADSRGITNVEEGSFVEFRATLHRHQLTEMLEVFETVLPMLVDTSEPQNRNKRNRPNTEQTNLAATLSQVKSMHQAVSGDGSQDLIAKLGDTAVVLTVEVGSFIEPTMNDVLDGTFRVLGKVTRVVTDSSDSINLLRRSPIAKFPAVREILSQLSSLEGLEFEGGIPETNIPSPTLQVIPIAIFA